MLHSVLYRDHKPNYRFTHLRVVPRLNTSLAQTNIAYVEGDLNKTGSSTPVDIVLLTPEKITVPHREVRRFLT